ncbi:MAG: hypothetical protein Kow0098_14580 [Ignavibacteriaceae bacterium]
MARKKKNKKRQIGQVKVETKPLLDKKQRNRLVTIVVLIILVIFFIVNNTRSVPERGPYPPNFDPAKVTQDSIRSLLQ